MWCMFAIHADALESRGMAVLLMCVRRAVGCCRDSSLPQHCLSRPCALPGHRSFIPAEHARVPQVERHLPPGCHFGPRLSASFDMQLRQLRCLFCVVLGCVDGGCVARVSRGPCACKATSVQSYALVCNLGFVLISVSLAASHSAPLCPSACTCACAQPCVAPRPHGGYSGRHASDRAPRPHWI